jgi:hypothetical protein
MVRRAMDRMGGRAWVESEPDSGSTFWLELPHADDAGAAPAPPVEESEPSAAAHALDHELPAPR